eukprot:GHUV01033967.1.p2 GENE.GHUV01033967.1~~GHUV01033967.1.p2  ORF type:complete len:109 (+),score=11.77 GHUV01033967.1:606-932(+)
MFIKQLSFHEQTSEAADTQYTVDACCGDQVGDTRQLTAISSITVSFSSSSSSSGPITYKLVPATADSRPGATILTPMAARTSLCSTSCPFTRISFNTCGKPGTAGDKS